MTKKIESRIKTALLAGEEYRAANGWLMKINAQDNVEIWPPKGEGMETTLAHLDTAIADFCKRADVYEPSVNQTQGKPSKVTDGDLGKDTSTKDTKKLDAPEKSPRPKPQGPKTPTSLGSDSSTKPGFSDPAVNKRPKQKVNPGDPSLGPDSSGKDTNWGDKKVKIQEDGRTGKKVAVRVSMNDVQFHVNVEQEDTSPDSYGYDPEVEEYLMEAARSDNPFAWCQLQVTADWRDEDGKVYQGKSGWLGACSYASEKEFMEAGDYAEDMKKEAYEDLLTNIEDADTGMKGIRPASKITDTFSNGPDPSEIYRNLKAKRPSKEMLEDIMDPEKWVANRVFADVSIPNDPSAELDDLQSELDQLMEKYDAGVGVYDVDEEKFWALHDAANDAIIEGDRGAAARSIKKMRSLLDMSKLGQMTEHKPKRGPGMPGKGKGTYADGDAGGQLGAGCEAEKEAVAPEGWEETVKKMKKHPEIDNPYALTNYMENEGMTPGGKDKKSNRTAWKARLQKEYEDFEEFSHYDEIYHLAERLGFDSAEEAWEANPMVSGSTNPADYKRIGSNRTAGPKLREKWLGDGGYHREIESESAEELHALVRGFGGEEVDWSKFKPTMPEEDKEAADGVDPAAEAPNPSTQTAKKASLASELSGAKIVKYDENTGLTYAWFGGHGIHIYSEDGTEVDFYNTGNFQYDSADPKAVEESIEGRINTNYEESEEEEAANTEDFGDEREAQVAGQASDVEAVDEEAKDVITKYMGDYGKELTKDDGVAPKKDDPKKKLKRAYNPHDPAGLRTPEELEKLEKQLENEKDHDYDEYNRDLSLRLKDKPFKTHTDPTSREAQAETPAPAAPAGSQPSTPSVQQNPQNPAGAKPPVAPEQKKGPASQTQLQPGVGDAGIQALGWTKEDVQAMTDDQKQKILQVQLSKPGTVPKTQAPAQQKAPAPAAPKAPPPSQPNSPVPAPGAEPAPPAPVQPAPKAVKGSKGRKRSQAAPQAPEEAPPAPAPQTPAAPAPKAPAAPQANPTTKPGADGGDEQRAFQILQEVQKQPVEAATPNEISTAKASLLMQRLSMELGMGASEAAKLFGLPRGNLTALFK